MNYFLVIKSDPDIEAMIKAESFEEAIDRFENTVHLDRELIVRNVSCDKCINTLNQESCDHES